MQDIGDTLREARMRQKIDVSEVETATKIRAKYLRALENEEFNLLPGSTYVKSFLRTYAEFLGLDARRLVEEYRAQHEPGDESELQQFPPQPGRGRDRRYGRRPGRGAAAVAILVALLAFLLVLGLTGGEEGSEPERAAPTGERGGRAPAGSGGRGGVSRDERPGRAARPRSVSLRVIPAEPTYVCVDRGPGTPPIEEAVLAAPRTFRGRRLRINLGKTSAELRANGRRVPIVPGPAPVGFDFRPNGRRELDVGERPCA